MPRRRSANTSTVSSAIRQVQQQARSLLTNLRKEIRTREAELQRLKKEESRLLVLIGSRGRNALSIGRGAGGAGATRVNWREVLAQLPKQFKAGDIRSVRGLKDKRPSEIFAAVTRWIESGAARRRSRGIYEKTGS